MLLLARWPPLLRPCESRRRLFVPDPDSDFDPYLNPPAPRLSKMALLVQAVRVDRLGPVDKL